MKLLPKETYKKIEEILYNYKKCNNDQIRKSIKEVKEFFIDRPHVYFLDKYYITRNEYKNRFPANSIWLKKICDDLYVEEPTGYRIKQELIYKTAMIFYKNGVIK